MRDTPTASLARTTQVIARVEAGPQGYIYPPGSKQVQRAWISNVPETSQEQIDFALNECHAEQLRMNRNAFGVPEEWTYAGFAFQQVIDGEGVFHNTVYSNYLPPGQSMIPPPDGGDPQNADDPLADVDQPEMFGSNADANKTRTGERRFGHGAGNPYFGGNSAIPSDGTTADKAEGKKAGSGAKRGTGGRSTPPATSATPGTLPAPTQPGTVQYPDPTVQTQPSTTPPPVTP